MVSNLEMITAHTMKGQWRTKKTYRVISRNSWYGYGHQPKVFPLHQGIGIASPTLCWNSNEAIAPPHTLQDEKLQISLATADVLPLIKHVLQAHNHITYNYIYLFINL